MAPKGSFKHFLMVELAIPALVFFQEMQKDLTTSSGYVVQPEITIPADATGINISNSGIVSVTVPGNDFGQK